MFLDFLLKFIKKTRYTPTPFYSSFSRFSHVSLSLSILFLASSGMLLAIFLSNIKLRVESSFIFSKSMRYII